MKVETARQSDLERSGVEVLCVSIRHCCDRDGILAFADVVVSWNDHEIGIQGCTIKHDGLAGKWVYLPSWLTSNGRVTPVRVSEWLHARIREVVLDEYNHQLLRLPRRRG